MDDIRALREVVLERAAALAEARLKQVIWDEARTLSLDELLSAAYLDGVRDAMDTLGFLLDGTLEA
jgi:hypothetical protein